jgi:putative transposase
VAQAFRPAYLIAKMLRLQPLGVPLRATRFITSGCYMKKPLLQSQRMANLFIEVLQHYRAQKKYLLHEFVVMPDHFHLLITPTGTHEHAMQLIKGGFSYRAARQFGIAGEIWQTSYQDYRVRDAEEYSAFRKYIHMNPVKRGLCNGPEDFPYSSAYQRCVLDAVPQWLKPLSAGC